MFRRLKGFKESNLNVFQRSILFFFACIFVIMFSPILLFTFPFYLTKKINEVRKFKNDRNEYNKSNGV